MSLGTTELAGYDTTIYIAVAVVLLSILYYLFQSRGIPPGPYGLPYLGLWHILKHDACHFQLQEYSKKYGDTFSFTYTGRLFIHFGSVKAVREAHIAKSDCFFERPNASSLLHSILNGGVVFMRGEGWKTVRKFFLNQFRERGMTTVKDHLSGPIYDIVHGTIADLRKSNGKPVDIAEILLLKCSKVMRQTFFGNHGITESEMLDFNKAYFTSLMSMTSINLLLIGNFARYFLLPFHMNVREGRKGHMAMRSILTKVIKRQKETYDENHVRNGIDAFFKEKKQREMKNDPTAQYFEDEVLLRSLLQINADGVLFVAMFVGCFIEAALDHPEEQEKVYRELMEVIGSDRNPEMEDKSKLTYTNAFFSEVMRTSDLFTIFGSLECSKETTVDGYRIPKGAITLYNFWAAHMNPKDYDEPEKFNPSRFLPKDGQKKPDLLSLFGIGKRSCLGEGFAMLQVFLFFTTILKNFRLTRSDEKAKGTSLFFYYDKIEVCAYPRN